MHHSKNTSQPPKRAGKQISLGPLSGDRKRSASSSVSSVSSVSSIDDLSDAPEDSEEDDADDEEDPPVISAPGKDKGHKAVPSKTVSKTTPHPAKKSKKNGKKKKAMRISDDDGYDDDNESEDSSDDVYAAVDYISDGDGEEQEMEKLEEMMILESENEQRIDHLLASTDVGDAGNWAGPTNIFDDHMLLSGASFFDEEQLYSAMETFGETDLASEAVETPVQMPRHVHFEPQSDSSSDSDSHTEDEIPGDFLQQDSLDPHLRRMIENDNDNSHLHHSRRRTSDDMFGESDYGHSNIYHVESDAVSEKSESSGYESMMIHVPTILYLPELCMLTVIADDGETTDEDLPPPATITHPRSILRRDSSASLGTPADDKTEPTPRRRGPVMGSFVPDPNKPVALVDRTGKHLVIIPAYASSRHDWLESASNSISGTANNSPRATTMQLIDESDTDALASPNQNDFSPMLASGANLMMTALGNDITPGGQVMGPPEAFYPSQDLAIDSSFEDDDDEDPESALNVDDFIDFGDGSSDDEMDEKQFDDDALTSPAVTSALPIPGPGSPTPRATESQQTNSAERFLNHLDRGIVTAFRRNHNRYQTLMRLPQHREFMPANSPARPASVFRQARLADQRTPSRKRKANASTGDAVRRKLMDAHRRSHLPF